MTEVCFLGRINQVSLIRKITFPYKTFLWFYKEVEISFQCILLGCHWVYFCINLSINRFIFHNLVGYESSLYILHCTKMSCYIMY